MSAYFDTGLLLKLYCTESNSRQAILLIQAHGTPIVFCGLQQTELQNALYRKAARKEMTSADLKTALRRIQTDVDVGVLRRPDLDWSEVWSLANKLTSKYALATQCRTLDILHVAVALELKIKTFCTTDARQLHLASKAGLKTVTVS